MQRSEGTQSPGAGRQGCSRSFPVSVSQYHEVAFYGLLSEVFGREIGDD